MGLPFLHFIGNFGDKNNQNEEKNRHGVLGFLEDTGQNLVKSGVRDVKTVGSFLDPRYLINDVSTLGKETAALATGNNEAYNNAANASAQFEKNSFMGKTYGSDTPGDTHGLGNAIGFGLDAATLGGGTVAKAGAKTAVEDVAAAAAPKALGFLSPAAEKIAVEAGKGAGYGAAYGADAALIDNKPKDILTEAGKGAAFGAAGGALVGGVSAGFDHLKNNATVVHAAGPETGPAGEVIAPADKNFFHGSEGGKLKIDNNGNINLGHAADDVSQFGDVVQLPKDNLTVAQIPSKEGMFKIAADPELKAKYLEKGIDVLQSENHSIAIDPQSFAEKTGATGLRPNPREGNIGDAIAAHEAQTAPIERTPTDAPAGAPIEAPGVNTPPPATTEGPNVTPPVDPAAPLISDTTAPTANVTPPVEAPIPPSQSNLPMGDHGGPEISALDKLNAKIVKDVPQKTDTSVKLTDIADNTVKSKAADAAQSVYGKLTKGNNLESDLAKVRSSLYDKYNSLTDFGKKYESITGDTLTPENDPAKIASLAAGAEAKFKARVDQLDEALQGTNSQAVGRLGVIDQALTDRSGLSNMGLTQRELSQARAELEAQLGPEAFKAAEAGVQRVRDIQREMLDYMGEVIGKDAVGRISDGNPNYFTKFDAVDHLIDNHANIKVGSSFSHATQDFIQSRGTKGIEGSIADPFQSMLRQWGKTVAFVESNKVGQAVGKMADNLEKLMGEDNQLAIKIRDADKVTERMGLYSDNKVMRPVADRADALASKSSKELKQLGREVKAAEGDLTKAVRKDTAKEVADNVDAVAAAKNLTTGDAKEIVANMVDMGEEKYLRIRNKIANREPKMEALMNQIDSLRNESEGIHAKIGANRDAAALLRDKELPAGYEKVSYFKNGVKEEVALPAEVADAMKNMSSKQADFITKTASMQSRVLRTGATSLNIAFIPKNLLRDFQTATVNTQHQSIMQMPINWVKAFGDAWVGGPTTKAFIDSGGGQAGFFSRGAGNIEKIAGDLGKSNAEKWGETITDPVKLLKTIATAPFKALTKVGEATELAPRLAEFKAAQADGLSNEAAAFAGRNITVDFARAGTLGQIANQWVPFLNARAQGNVNIFKAIKRDPARAGAVLATTMVAPVVATYMWNRQNYSDVYDQIPDYVKQNNFIMIYGNQRATNPDGTPGAFTQVVKIPKGEVGQIFGNPLENMLDYAYGHNPESLAGIATDTLSQASPISFARKGQVDPALAVSSILPPAVKGTLENSSNHSFFRDAPIVSNKLAKLPNNEQFDKGTSPAAKFIGEVTGQSPLKVDNMIQSVGGGLGQQLANPTKFVTAPAGAFSGANGNEVNNQFYSYLDKTSPLRASASNKINDAIKSGNMDLASQIAQNYNAKLREEFKPFVKEYGHLATQDMVDQFQKQKLSLTSATINQRATAIESAKKKQRHAQEMAGIITG